MGPRAAIVNSFRAVNRDARHWQIMALGGLFILSWQASDFGASPKHLAAALIGAMAMQLVGTVLVNARRARAGNQPARGSHWRASRIAGAAAMLNDFQWKSALITSLSLSILLRATSPWFWLAAGVIGVGAKFALRYRGKHIFNPACIGIVAVSMLAGSQAWVSPGQWGQAPLFAAFAIGFAALVLSSAKRLDIAIGFLVGFAAMLFGRALYLGDPMAIPIHQMQSGALLVFAFFMITDPRSTPDNRLARLIFAFAVAAFAAWLSWEHHVRGSMLYALAALAILTPILDRLLPARRFEWMSREGRHDNTQTPDRGVRARPYLVRA